MITGKPAGNVSMSYLLCISVNIYSIDIGLSFEDLIIEYAYLVYCKIDERILPNQLRQLYFI